MSVFQFQYYLEVQINEDEMCRSCDMHGVEE